MRTCNLGLDAPVKNWSPKFRASTASKRQPAERSSGFVSYYPTLKGEPRMEGLRHYFHANMAEILEMDPTVIRWTARSERFTFSGGQKPLTVRPDMFAICSVGQRAIRLLKATEANERRRERHADLRVKFGEIGIVFESLTDAELAADPRVRLAKDIRYNRYRDCREGLVVQCVEAFNALQQPTLGSIHRSLGGDQDLWLEILSLVAKGFIEIGLDDGMTPDTPVRACKLEGYCDE